MSLQFSVFPRRESPGFLIYRTGCMLKAGLKRAFRAKGFKVTPEQWSVLSILWESEGMHQSPLASRASKDRHNITRILNLLERDGLIKREPSSRDKRCQRVYLTDQAKTLVPELIPIVAEFLSGALAGLPEEDVTVMQRVLERILGNLTGDSSEREKTWQAPQNECT